VTIQNGPNNRVLLDGTEIAHDQSKVGVLEIAPGIFHKLVVEAPGRRTFEKDFVVATGTSIDIPIALENEEHPAAPTRGSGKTHLPSGARIAKEAPTPVANRTLEPRPVPLVTTPPTEPAATKPERKPVSEENVAPSTRPTRAQERGLLDVNPLRR
jgi:hypothetical protein